MSPAVVLPSPPDVPITDLSRDRIRELASAYGHFRRLAGDRFASLLPIVFRDRIYEDDGCVSGYEWAAKKGSMTKAEVDRVLALWDRIGHHDCLWRLLAKGVGITKLERVAPHVTEANAAGLARRVQKLTGPELQKWLAGQRVAAGRASAGMASPDVPPTKARADAAPGTAARGDEARERAAAGADSCGAMGQAGSAQDEVGDGLGERRRPSPAVAESVSCQAKLSFGQPLVVSGTGPPDGVAADSHRDAAPDFEPDALPPGLARTARRFSLEVDAIDEKRIQELLNLYQRLHGKRIGLGQLFGLLARWAMARGELPSLEDLAAGLSAGSARPDEPPKDPGTSSAASASGDGAAASEATPPAAKRFVPRVQEVVVSIRETDWKFVRTALGWIPVPDGALTGFLSRTEAVPLADLRIAAVEAASRTRGSSTRFGDPAYPRRHRPAAVNRYLLARSGGYCEVGQCPDRAIAAHHRQRFSFDPSHHPDVLVCVCRPHHGLPHQGEIANEWLDPHAWEVTRAGEPSREDVADVQFQVVRRVRVAGP
ncbi:MAG: hypothetical protein FJZ01_06670 [Candidatus Sericytochromatia bacterium]|nr:hypothetical protein [Candidatus Tanganyikabacteria bacterium]